MIPADEKRYGAWTMARSLSPRVNIVNNKKYAEDMHTYQ
jgi:hypothetical protein